MLYNVSECYILKIFSFYLQKDRKGVNLNMLYNIQYIHFLLLDLTDLDEEMYTNIFTIYRKAIDVK